jgi:hypothetical protein
MSPEDLIRTSLLLGAFVLLAGLYGLLYSAGLLFNNQGLFVAGQVSFGLQCLVTLAIILMTPLAPWWKLLVVVSSAIYCCIPPVTWRYLQRIHEREGEG